jgi:hypothetical protein
MNSSCAYLIKLSVICFHTSILGEIVIGSKVEAVSSLGLGHEMAASHGLDMLSRAMRHATRNTRSIVGLGFADTLIILIDLEYKVSRSIISTLMKTYVNRNSTIVKMTSYT